MAFSSSMGSSSLSWTGWIVPRILPRTGGDAASKSINAATERHQIDPSLLCPGRGPAFHPFQLESSHHDGTRGLDTSNLEQTVPRSILDGNSELTLFDAFVYPPSDDGEHLTDPFHVRMERSSQELIHQTLQRMLLSINKLVLKRLAKRKGEKKGEQRTSHLASSIRPDGITFFKQSGDASGRDPDLSTGTNQEVWSRVIGKGTGIRIQLENAATIALRVDACPPTIVDVQTFEDFSSRAFCDVPLVVQVRSLFATHATVDWYVGDELVAKDSPSYTPQSTDIGKPIAVLITPQRRSDNHIGRGYEEAYRFVHPVEALPENTVVNLRRGDLWTNPNRRKQSSDDSSLRVVTFNILADQNAYERTRSSNTQIPCRPYVTLETLDKARRMPLILHELLTYQADVLCLQEVDENIWKRLFQPALEQAGYQAYFCCKVSKGTSEGCALAWSLHRFEATR
jgi:hypothetical protein